MSQPEPGACGDPGCYVLHADPSNPIHPPHCSTCVCGRRAPVQASHTHNKPAGTVAWWEHEQAWTAYGMFYSQSAERIAQRGGFSYRELVTYLGHEPTTWSPRGT